MENGGFGSTWAAPIASLMIEQYLTDTVTRPPFETKMLEKNFIAKKDSLERLELELETAENEE